MSTELWIMIIALLFEGPLAVWLTLKFRKEDGMNDKFKELHDKIDELEEDKASKEYVNSKVAHLQEVTSVQFQAIMENLHYIRSRVDDQQRSKD